MPSTLTYNVGGEVTRYQFYPGPELTRYEKLEVRFDVQFQSIFKIPNCIIIPHNIISLGQITYNSQQI